MKSLIIMFILTISFVSTSFGKKEDSNYWHQIVKSSKNKTVKLHAWGGSKNINNYLQWVKDQVSKKYGIIKLYKLFPRIVV